MTALGRPAHTTRPDPAERPQPPLRVVGRPARAARDRRKLLLVGGALVFAAVLGGNVAVHAQTAQGQFELERLQTAARQRQAHYQQLRLQVAELEAPQRITARARQMGMVEPPNVTYLRPPASTLTRDPATPDAALPGDQAAQSWAYVKSQLDRRR